MTILGAIEMRKRTKLEGLQVYLGSLRQQNPTVQVVIFNRSPEHPILAGLLQRAGVTSIDAVAFDQLHAIPPIGIEFARFLQYRAWLHRHTPDRVVMTDVLDVLWQADPAMLPTEDSLQVFQENIQISACPYNRRWMRDRYPAEYERWCHHTVVCCGVMMGSANRVRTYLDWYAENVATRGADANRRGFDSALANGYALLHPEVLETVPFSNVTCMHLGYAPPATVSYDGIVRCGDYAPALVHQYNRHPEVTKGLYERWT